MQLSGAPAQLVLPWANGDSSKTNPIPVPSQQGVTPGAASWTDGFPPLCATPVTSGGLPPTKADMNGGLFQMSAVDVWTCAGGGFPYSSAFATAIGGYPKGARVLMASGLGYWQSTVDNNMTDPDTGGAGWSWKLNGSWCIPGGSSNAYLALPAYAPAPTSYTAGDVYRFIAPFSNTAAATLNVNSLGPKNIYKTSASGPVALAAGDITAGNVVTVVYDGTEFQMAAPFIPSTWTRQGSGSGNYSTGSTEWIAVDGTNLAIAVTIPVGWKMIVSASGSGICTADVLAYFGLSDSVNGILQAAPINTPSGGADAYNFNQGFSLLGVIAGDGTLHTVELQFKTSNGSDPIELLNLTDANGVLVVPSITFILMPSN